MKLIRTLVPFCLALLVLLSGCPKRQVQQKTAPADPEQLLAQALNDKRAKRFQQAEDALTYIIFNFPGSIQAADAQFFLADCYFDRKNYAEAEREFDFYLKNFPNGRYQEEAAFKMALAALYAAPPPYKDQSQALKAQDLLNDFLYDYPESRFRAEAERALTDIQSRLAYREFEAARLYFRAGEFKSALVYYEFIQDNYHLTSWSESDRYRLALCYAETGEKDKAVTILKELAGNALSTKIRQAAQNQLNRFQHH